MAAMTIRNIDEQLKARLRVRAAQHGRSMEDEARDILRGALSVEPARGASLVDAIRADLPIIIASGYGEDVLQGRFAHDPLVRFLPKPYNMRQLEEALRAVGVSAGSAIFLR